MRAEKLSQQLIGEILQPRATSGNKVGLNISVRGFWKAAQIAFFYVRVFNPNAEWCGNLEFSKVFNINEKKRKKGKIYLT